ncbi:MAG TPA: CDC27 family protein [Polyangiaceae bacterium]|nr:CDC27 family protein [Polyangiaceae bacterium]
MLSGVLLCASPAFAEDAETRTAARDLATQGAQAFEAGDYARASDFFRRAHELVPAPSIALLRARSLAKLGQLLEAIDIYEQTARFKLPDDAPEAYLQAVETARIEMEDVRHRLPRLKLTLVGVSSSEPVQVNMDDRPTPGALLGVERPINPGQHRIEARVAGQLRATRELDIVEGQSYQIELDVRPAQPAPKPVVVVQPPAPSAGKPHSWRKTGGYVALGVGALGLGIGTYTGLVALHHKSELDSVCKPSCPPSSADDIDSFRSNRTISYVSFGVGVAAAATGVALLTIGKPAEEHLAIRALPSGLQIDGRL